MITNNIKKGIFLALVTSFISGLAIFYNKLVITEGIDPLIFNILKNGGVVFVLSIFLLKKPQKNALLQFSTSFWLKLVSIGVIGGSIPFVLFFQGLKTAPAINANLIHKTLFIWVAAMAIPLLGERLNLKQIMGYLLIVLANFSLGGFSGFSFNQGEILIFLATFLWAVENIIAKITLKNTEAIFVAWGRMFFGALILLAIATSQNKLILLTQLSFSQLLLTVGSILLLTGYVTTWYHALKQAPATIVSSVLILATPITNILTSLFITRSFPQTNVLYTVALFLAILTIAFHVSPAKPAPREVK